MYKFIIEVSIFGHYCNIFNNYIIADNEEKSLQIADELLSRFYAGNVRLSDFTYRVDIIGETSFKVVYKIKRKMQNVTLHVRGHMAIAQSMFDILTKIDIISLSRISRAM